MLSGHGGNGGGPGYAGKSYDSVFLPSLPGSSGASSAYSGYGGAGGGVIKIVAATLNLNGTISANGANGGGLGAGGGAGGSILIQTSQLAGFGLVSVNGGGADSYGSASGCGGAGGRVAIYYKDNSLFTGTLQAFGGNGPSYYGGPGTIYLENTAPGSQYKKLIVNNNGAPTATAAISNTATDSGIAYLTDTGVGAYGFDEVSLAGNGHLAMVSVPTAGQPLNLTLQRFTGDRSGMLHVQSGQRADLSVVGAEMQGSQYVYLGGQLLLGEQVWLSGVSWTVRGIVSGVESLELRQGAQVLLGQTGTMFAGNVSSGSSGIFSVDQLTTMNDATISMVLPQFYTHC